MPNNPYILVLPGWYPGSLQPSNGDFVREQVSLLRKEDIRMDLAYSDLNIGFIKAAKFCATTAIHSDAKGNIDYLRAGPFWPKNNYLGLDWWVNASYKWVKNFINTRGIPSILHAHTYLGGMIAQRVHKEYNIPYIITEHYTGWVDQSIPSFHSKRGVSAFNSAHLITAVSPFLQKELQQLTNTKVDFLPNFIDTELFSAHQSIKGPKINSLVFIGDLIPRKQIDLAIRAFASLHHADKVNFLTVVGRGSEEYELRKLAIKLNVEQQIHFAGRKSKYVIASILKKADLLIHPSRLETFGLVVAEALCTGKQVVCFQNGGISAFEGLPGLHICADMNEHSLKEGIESAMKKHQEIAPTLISEKAKERFSPKRLSEALNIRYLDLLI